MKSLLVIMAMLPFTLFGQPRKTNLVTDIPRFALAFDTARVGSVKGLAPGVARTVFIFNPLNMTLVVHEGGKKRVERVYEAKTRGFGHSAIPVWRIACAYETLFVEFEENRDISAEILGDNQWPIYYTKGRFLVEPDTNFLAHNLQLLEMAKKNQAEPETPETPPAPAPALRSRIEQGFQALLGDLAAASALCPQSPVEPYNHISEAMQTLRVANAKVAIALAYIKD